MQLSTIFREALQALVRNRVRSLLTMLGVIIGVAAVVVLVAIGTGTKQEIEQQVEGLGSNLLLIVPGEVSFSAAPTVSRLRLSDGTTALIGGWFDLVSWDDSFPFTAPVGQFEPNGLHIEGGHASR